MKKCSEYSEKIIEQLSADLRNELLSSIYDMIANEEQIDEDIVISDTQTVTCMTVYLDEELTELNEGRCSEPEVVDYVEVTYTYEDENLIYSDTKELADLELYQLLAIWNFLRNYEK